MDKSLLFELTPALTSITSVETGCFVVLNDEWEKILGWSKEELKAKPFIEFVHDEDKEATILIAEKLKLHPSITTKDFENRYQHKDGTWRWLRWTARVSEGYFYAVAHDITRERELGRSILDKLQSITDE